MKKREKMILAALLVSVGLFSYPNAAKYVERLSIENVKKMLQVFDTKKADIKSRELIGGGALTAASHLVG